MRESLLLKLYHTEAMCVGSSGHDKTNFAIIGQVSAVTSMMSIYML